MDGAHQAFEEASFPMIRFAESNEEILYTKDSITKIGRADIAFLKARADKNGRKRVRICVHSGIDDPLHEMLIVQKKGNYIPPHKHPGKSESFHMIEGSLKVVLFNDDGSVLDVIKLDAAMPGKDLFYYRLSESLFHTVIFVSDFVVFHETTNGPFRREDMIIPEWAPDDDAGNEEINSFMAKLNGQLCAWKH